MPLRRENFRKYFGEPAPKATYLSDDSTPYPYRICLYEGSPEIYLYGLDSTRVDAAVSPGLFGKRAGRPKIDNILAKGFIDPKQLETLENSINKEKPVNPRIRIAALHHPLVWPKERRLGITKNLIDLDQVLKKLQRMGFSAALCGHLHKGFVRPNGATDVSPSPIWVLSVGSATQIVRFSNLEKEILKKSYHENMSDVSRDDLDAVLEKCNEYRIYNLSIDSNKPNQLILDIQSYISDPEAFEFSQNPKNLEPIIIPY